jgi:hypothetical protein
MSRFAFDKLKKAGRHRLLPASVALVLVASLVLPLGLAIAEAPIGSADIQSGAIKTSHIAKGAVAKDRIAKRAVAKDTLAAGAVSHGKIRNKAIRTRHIAKGAVTPEKLSATYYTKGEVDALVGGLQAALDAQSKIIHDLSAQLKAIQDELAGDDPPPLM